MLHFFIFGSHPRISLAELRAVKPNLQTPELFGPTAIFDDPSWDDAFLNNKLGGLVKLGDIIKKVDLVDFNTKLVTEIITAGTKNKAVNFGLTVYASKDANKKKFVDLGIKVKKEIKAMGLPARWVCGKEGTNIAPAAVAKLDMIERGTDICLFIDSKTISIGVTTQVQDADAWSLRDFGRPARDSVSGMLPPKLARIIVNLARVESGDTIIDPFCGCGTILMEAALATDTDLIIGTDIDDKQIQYSKNNISWLIKKKILTANDQDKFLIKKADARTLQKTIDKKIDAVITEGYLGPPLSGDETRETLKDNVLKISNLWRETYEALLPILKPKARLVCIWPSFKTSHGTARVDLSSDEKLLQRYKILNPLRGWDDSDDPLLYHRLGQRVMRRIVILEKK
ncbi:MAG: hypothetical protein ABIB04_03755 [Patescibacteria group bacterium]